MDLPVKRGLLILACIQLCGCSLDGVDGGETVDVGVGGVATKDDEAGGVETVGAEGRCQSRLLSDDELGHICLSDGTVLQGGVYMEAFEREDGGGRTKIIGGFAPPDRSYTHTWHFRNAEPLIPFEAGAEFSFELQDFSRPRGHRHEIEVHEESGEEIPEIWISESGVVEGRSLDGKTLVGTLTTTLRHLSGEPRREVSGTFVVPFYGLFCHRLVDDGAGGVVLDPGLESDYCKRFR